MTLRGRPTPGRRGFALRLALVVLAGTACGTAAALLVQSVAGGVPAPVRALVAVLVSVPAAFLLGGTALARRHENALAAARTDDGTGLGSPSAFRRDLERAVAAAVRDGLPLVLGLVEASGVGEVVDAEGRRVADGLLRSAGGSLRRLSRRDGDLEAYRVGMQTFAVVLTSTSLDDAFTVADAVSRRIAEHAAPLRATVGLAVLAVDRTPDAEHLVMAADAALEHARSLGGGRVVAAAAAGSGLRWVASHG